MKLSQSIIATVGLVNAFNPVDDGERRYRETVKIIEFYNPQVDMKQMTSYGCNCFAAGDRPLSGGTIRGHPVDPLDQMCKDYKDCLACAIEAHGNDCVPEFIEGSMKGRYKVAYGNNADPDNVTCKDTPGTCKRDLCECSKKLGKQISSKDWFDLYDQSKSAFYGDFDTAAECSREPNGRSVDRTPKCCQDKDKEGPFSKYFLEDATCCQNTGQIQPNGELVC